MKTGHDDASVVGDGCGGGCFFCFPLLSPLLRLTGGSSDKFGQTALFRSIGAGDEDYSSYVVQNRQVHSSGGDEACSVEYLNGGMKLGFNYVVGPSFENPVLFRVKGTKKKRTLTQVPLSKNSLNEGDSFILLAGKANVWCWHGKNAKPIEKADSTSWAESMCTLGTTQVLDQGHGDEDDSEFWNYLGEGTIGTDDNDDEAVTEFAPLLFRVEGDLTRELVPIAKGKPIQKTAREFQCLNKADLSEDGVFLMDTGWEIYVWIGSETDSLKKNAAMFAADKYAKQNSRTLELPVHVVKSGQESDRFLSYLA